MAQTANDVLLDWSISHAVFLQRYSAGVVRRIIALLNRSDADIVALLQSADPQIDRYRLENLLEQIRALNATIIRRMESELNAELQDLVQAEIASQAEALTEAIPAAIRADLTILAPAPVQVWAAAQARPFHGVLMRDMYQRLEASQQRRLSDAIRMGFVEGESIDQMVRRVRGTYGNQYKDGILEVGRREAVATVRTAVNHVANVARQETFRQSEGVIAGVRWVSVIDGRTSMVCMGRSGKVYPIDSGPRPPAHWNCRSTTVPVLKSWRQLGFDRDDLPPSSQASMDGQIPETMTYGDWLRTKPRSFVVDTLGPTRAKLFLDGNLSLDKFTNRAGDELSLSEIRRREREAWRRAGLSEAA